MVSGAAPQRRSVHVTGAASGIGRATAELFARRGRFVGCIDRDAPGLQGLRREPGEDKATYAAVDTTDQPALVASWHSSTCR